MQIREETPTEHWDFFCRRTLETISKTWASINSCPQKVVKLHKKITKLKISILLDLLSPGFFIYTEAKRCFATHDEDIGYFNMRIYYFNRMRIYVTVQLCSITSLWHSGQHLCRAIGRLQVRISLGFWLLSKRRSL